MDVVALLLAAGESERMGTPKALLEWRGQPLLSHQIQQIQKSRARECVVVLGKDAARLERLVRAPMRPGWKARPVYNPRHGEGKSTSIQAGLAAIAALLAAAESEWERCEAAGRRPIVVPAFHGRPGHPPLFCASLFAELMGVCEETHGLKAVVRRNPARVLHLPWDDSGILLNLNTPLDLPAIDAWRQLR